MPFYSPKEVVEKAGEAAIHRISNGIPRTLVLGFLAGAYIALGGLISIMIAGGVPELTANNPGLQKFLMGAFFPLGLILCIIAGADLFTGNTAYFLPPLLSKKIKFIDLIKNWTLVYVSNFIGALFVAYILSYLTDIFASDPWYSFLHQMAEKKTSGTFLTIFFKGIGANWLVALAVWLAMASQNVGGKIAAVWFPVMAFVAIGFEHSVANMFFLPLAIFYDAPISVTEVFLNNLLPATLGNIVGGSLMVGTFYWFVYERQ